MDLFISMKDVSNIYIIYEAAVKSIKRLENTDFLEPFVVKAIWGLAKLKTIDVYDKIHELVEFSADQICDK